MPPRPEGPRDLRRDEQRRVQRGPGEVLMEEDLAPSPDVVKAVPNNVPDSMLTPKRA